MNQFDFCMLNKARRGRAILRWGSDGQVLNAKRTSEFPTFREKWEMLYYWHGR